MLGSRDECNGAQGIIGITGDQGISRWIFGVPGIVGDHRDCGEGIQGVAGEHSASVS